MNVNNHWIFQSIHRDLYRLLEPTVPIQSLLNLNVQSGTEKLQVFVETEEKYIEKMKDAILKAYQGKFFAAQSDLKTDEENHCLTFFKFIDHCMIKDKESNKIHQFGPVTLEITFAEFFPEIPTSPDSNRREISTLEAHEMTVNMIDESLETIVGIKRVLNHKFVQDGSSRTYNQFISVGSWCIGADYLKQRKWASKTYPFDWTFSNLNAIIYSVSNPMFPLEELEKKQNDRRRFSESDVQHTLEFPHQESTNMQENIAAMDRRCQRWKAIVNQDYNATSERQLIAIVHFARPQEKYLKVLNCLKRLLRQLRNFNPNFDFEIISIWHRVWNAKDDVDRRNNKVFYLGNASTTLPSSNCSNRIHIYLARVSNEWDGNNWSGRMQKPLLDEIFNQFSFKPIE